MSIAVSGLPYDAEQTFESVDLNVDAALLLRRLIAEDYYPTVLALMPNVADEDDQRRVDDVMTDALHQAGLMRGGRVHPTLAGWIQALCAPQRELAILATAGDMVLRMVLVRHGTEHVLASRCDDSVVIQPFGPHIEDFDTALLAEPILAALGPAAQVTVAPVTGPADELTADHPQTLIEWGASPMDAAQIVAVAAAAPDRITEIHVVEHGTGNLAGAKNVIRIVDTALGRLMIGPAADSRGTTWATIGPANAVRLRGAVADLIEMLPARSWL